MDLSGIFALGIIVPDYGTPEKDGNIKLDPWSTDIYAKKDHYGRNQFHADIYETYEDKGHEHLRKIGSVTDENPFSFYQKIRDTKSPSVGHYLYLADEISKLCAEFEKDNPCNGKYCDFRKTYDEIGTEAPYYLTQA